MPQTKKKQATKTAAKRQARPAKKTACTKTRCQQISDREKMHVYIVTVMGMIAALLLCADVAMVIV